MATFNDLWINHPSNWVPPNNFPCKDKKGKVHDALYNQCAIRLGLSFQGAGIDTSTLSGSRCWNRHGKKHILKVKNIVPWIEKNTSLIGCKPKVPHKKVTFAKFAGLKGICYFQNFYGAGNQGDHVDLWNGFWIAKGDLDYFGRSEEVWFWQF
jgi:hypothetical protein